MICLDPFKISLVGAFFCSEVAQMGGLRLLFDDTSVAGQAHFACDSAELDFPASDRDRGHQRIERKAHRR
jgi:hypothetical protein